MACPFANVAPSVNYPIHYSSPVRRYESSRIFEKLVKHLLRGYKGQGPLTGVWGRAPFFSFLAPPPAAQKEKKGFRGLPDPGRGRLPSALPLIKQAKRTFQVLEKFGMTHRRCQLCA